jgi:hypothetical protein
MGRSLTEWVVKWAPLPPFPEFSQVYADRERAAQALAGSAYEGTVMRRTVTYGEWERA